MLVNVWVVIESEQDCTGVILGVFVTQGGAYAFLEGHEHRDDRRYCLEVEGPFEVKE